MLDGIQRKVDGEIKKGMDCLTQAKAELQVSSVLIARSQISSRTIVTKVLQSVQAHMFLIHEHGSLCSD